MGQGPDTPTLAVLHAPPDIEAARTWLEPGGIAERLATVAKASPSVRDVVALVPPELTENTPPPGLRLAAVESPEPLDLELARLRRFSPTGWRDGPMALTAFDEGVRLQAAVVEARKAGAERILFVPASSWFGDPAQVRLLLDTRTESFEETAFRFTRAPQGFNLFSWLTSRATQALQVGRGPGSLFVYSPETFVPDPALTKACLPLPPEVVNTARAFRADTARGRAFCRAVEPMVGEAGWRDGALEAVCKAGREVSDAWRGNLPRVLRIELTTRRNATPQGVLPELCGPPVDLDTGRFRTIVDEFAQYDDGVVTLGGWGEPLLHPEAQPLIEYAAARCPTAVSTDGLNLTEETVRALTDARVALVSVRFGVWGREPWRELHGVDRFEEALAGARRVVEITRQAGFATPLLVPEVVKIPQGEATLEDFYDTWWPGPAWPVVRGHNDLCGKLAPLSQFVLVPGVRRTCRSLEESMTVLPDGRAAMCGQDYDGAQALGHASEGLETLFLSTRLQAAREAHRAENPGAASPLCGSCNRWATL